MRPRMRCPKAHGQANQDKRKVRQEEADISLTVSMSSGRGRRRGRARGRGRTEGQDAAETDTSRPSGSAEISTQTECNTSGGDQPAFTEEQQSWLSQFIENQVATCEPQRERPTVEPQRERPAAEQTPILPQPGNVGESCMRFLQIRHSAKEPYPVSQHHWLR